MAQRTGLSWLPTCGPDSWGRFLFRCFKWEIRFICRPAMNSTAGNYGSCRSSCPVILTVMAMSTVTTFSHGRPTSAHTLAPLATPVTLTAVADSVRVRDIVAGGTERPLIRDQTTNAGVEDICHDTSPETLLTRQQTDTGETTIRPLCREPVSCIPSAIEKGGGTYNRYSGKSAPSLSWARPAAISLPPSTASIFRA